MVQGRFKSGHYRRVQRKLPGNRTTTQFKEGKPSQPHCGRCGKALHGIARMTKVEAQHAPKTAKRPQRPFGGALCSACMRIAIIEKL